MQLIKKDITIDYTISYKKFQYKRQTTNDKTEWLYKISEKWYYYKERVQELRGIYVEELEIQFQTMLRKQKLERICQI